MYLAVTRGLGDPIHFFFSVRSRLGLENRREITQNEVMHRPNICVVRRTSQDINNVLFL